MNKKRTILGGAILVAVIMLSIGYAVIENIPLNITGSATANVSDDNFLVEFDEATDKTTVSNEDKVSASVTGIHAAKMDVTGLSAKGDSVYAIFTINNKSADLSAELSVSAENISETDNAGYFSIATEITEPKIITKGGSTTVKVTVTLEKTPVDGTKTGEISVALSAKPVQP